MFVGAGMAFTVSVGELDPVKFVSPAYRADISCAEEATYVTVHVASPFVMGWLAHDPIGCPLSRNSSEPVGSTGPGRAAGGATDAVYVVLEPTLIEGDASSDVAVESGPTVMLSVGLTEPLRIEPVLGVKTAVSCAFDAANDVEHATVALWPRGVTGMFAHPRIAPPAFSNVTAPQSAVLPAVTDVTVAISVTPWFVTGAAGEVSKAAVVGCEAGGVGAAATVAVLLLVAEALPPGPLAVTTQTIVSPMSAADSV
jgi:hypothetical protein